MAEPIAGVYAAVITPRSAGGTLDENAIRNTLEFLIARGVRGFAINGATGEYCITTSTELERILTVARDVVDDKAEILCGIGSAGIHGSLASAAIAADHGARALLLPMPHFFIYEQDDLEAWCSTAARQAPAPILLYNLPAFSTGMETSTVLRLLAATSNVIGVKDSSGSLDILQALTAGRVDARRMLGNDSVLADALRLRVCDGVISGVACVLPELILSLFAEGQRPESPEFKESAAALTEFLHAIEAFPVPWALKWLAEVRGLATANFSQPLSARRVAQGRSLQKWFEKWNYAARLKPSVPGPPSLRPRSEGC